MSQPPQISHPRLIHLNLLAFGCDQPPADNWHLQRHRRYQRPGEESIDITSANLLPAGIFHVMKEALSGGGEVYTV